MIKYIFFDCLETIIDFKKIPDRRDYAMFAFKNSIYSTIWSDFDSFLEKYDKAKDELIKSFPLNREYNLTDRISLICDTIDHENKKQIADDLLNNYCKKYYDNCYVEDNVKNTLMELYLSYKMAVVSNFIITDGINRLLKMFDIFQYFSFIISSIDFGWRKPDEKIYEHAIEKSSRKREEIIFIGDDYQNDYIMPRKLGMHALLYDKDNKNKSIDHRVDKFRIIPDYIKKNFNADS